MDTLAALPDRVRVDGKFFRVGEERFQVKGVSYGPFAPVHHPDGFASKEQTRRDFERIHELGANVVRVYHVPPVWFLDLAHEYGIRVFVDVPWPKHLCFLRSGELVAEAHRQVREAAELCREHPGVFALSIVNEIPADIARWSGPKRIAQFIDDMVDETKSVDPDRLVTFTNFPPTEYLESRSCDFVCFNVYLHDPGTFDRYLSRLQMLAGSRPLVLGEFGMDSLREGESHKCEFLAWQIELASRRGLAGTVVFSFTDDWFRGGMQVDDWAFGLTKSDRTPKPSFEFVQQAYAQAPYFPLKRVLRVSVVVASYNGGRTLDLCLQSLSKLNYGDYEVILVDDGSTDNTREIAARYPHVRAIHQPNMGLSAARNAGIAAATGEIVAFTDSDCRADEDWLFYLVGDLLDFSVSAIGGHNLLPPEDSCVAAAVMASPGGPAHVMFNDRDAEHIPGCNMAFFKSALNEIGGFDPVFLKAGDDVDVCWRLQQLQHKIAFSPSGFVWHYRRSTVNAYLRQQSGYGEADALLARKHPNYFNKIGGSIWRGRIYASGQTGVVLRGPLVHHGIFGSGFFQCVYAAPPSFPLMMCTSLEYYLFLVAPTAVAGWLLVFPWPLVGFLCAVPLTVSAIAAWQAEIPRRQQRFWSRPLVALLFLLQPLERGLARYRGRMQASSRLGIPKPADSDHDAIPAIRGGAAEMEFWSAKFIDRFEVLSAVIKRLRKEDWQIKADTGWSKYDAEIDGFRWARARMVTATESLEMGATTLRWRLESSWTTEATIYFWMLIAAELLTIGFSADLFPWIWMILLTLPVINLVLEYQQTRCLQHIARAVTLSCEAFGLVAVADKTKKPDQTPKPANAIPAATYSASSQV